MRISEKVLVIQDTDSNYETITVSKELYDKFNKMIIAQETLYSNPTEYVKKHFEEMLRKYSEK